MAFYIKAINRNTFEWHYTHTQRLRIIESRNQAFVIIANLHKPFGRTIREFGQLLEIPFYWNTLGFRCGRRSGLRVVSVTGIAASNDKKS